MKRNSLAVLSVITVFSAVYAITAQADTGRITPLSVTEHIYTIIGDGGNVGIFTGEDGTFLIDDNFAPLTEKIVEAIQSVEWLFHSGIQHAGGSCRPGRVAGGYFCRRYQFSPER